MNVQKTESARSVVEKRSPNVWKKMPLFSGKDESVLDYGMLEDTRFWEKTKERMIRGGEMDFPTRQKLVTDIVRAVEDGILRYTAQAVGIQRGLGLLTFAWIHNPLQGENWKAVRTLVTDDISYAAAGYTKLLFREYPELRPEILLRVKRALAQFPGFYASQIMAQDKENGQVSSVLDGKLSQECILYFTDRHDHNVLLYILSYEPGVRDVPKLTGRGAQIASKMMGYAGEEMKAELEFREKGPNEKAGKELAAWSNDDLSTVIEKLDLSKTVPFATEIDRKLLESSYLQYS